MRPPLSDSFPGILRFIGQGLGRGVDQSFSICFENGVAIAVAYCGVLRRGHPGGDARKTKSDARKLPESGAIRITKVFPHFSRGLTGEALSSLPTFPLHQEITVGGRSGIREVSRVAVDP